MTYGTTLVFSPRLPEQTRLPLHGVSSAADDGCSLPPAWLWCRNEILPTLALTQASHFPMLPFDI